MNDEGLDTETQLHALVCGRLDESERLAVLNMLARNEAARDLLREMLDLQENSRRALGYGAADLRARDSLREVAGLGQAALPGRHGTVRPNSYVLRAAAAVAVLACAGAAILTMAHRQELSRQIDMLSAQVAKHERSLEREASATSRYAMKPSELNAYRRLCHEITLPSDTGQPWVLLTNDGGRFEYVPGRDRSPSYIALRCVVFEADAPPHTVNLLMPAGPALRLKLADLGDIAGQTVHCTASVEGGSVVLDLSLGMDVPTAVGIRGQTRADGQMRSIGQFRVGDRDVRVFVQAVAMEIG
jgi:hypothetical protein